MHSLWALNKRHGVTQQENDVAKGETKENMYIYIKPEKKKKIGQGGMELARVGIDREPSLSPPLLAAWLCGIGSHSTAKSARCWRCITQG